MNKILLSIIIFLVGLISGYSFIIFAGYTAYWTGDLVVIFANILKKYEMLYLLGVVMGVKEVITLILTAIPIFLISSFLLTYFIKTNLKLMKWLSSLGLVIIPIFASIIYKTSFFTVVIIVSVPLLVNLFFISTMTKK